MLCAGRQKHCRAATGAGQCHHARTQLMDIMMAQDFQDLTGKVIKQVTELANDIERQLVQFWSITRPPRSSAKTTVS